MKFNITDYENDFETSPGLENDTEQPLEEYDDETTNRNTARIV